MGPGSSALTGAKCDLQVVCALALAATKGWSAQVMGTLATVIAEIAGMAGSMTLSARLVGPSGSRLDDAASASCMLMDADR